jgi:hypothetical protein
MFKKNQKRTALLVMVAFVWLLRVSSMPLAAHSTEQVGSAKSEPAPGFIEQQGPEWDQGRKKNTALIIVLGLVAVCLLYLLIHGIDFEASPSSATRTSGANGKRINKR